MQAPRLVATDVDGTLLRPDETVGTRTAAVIERLIDGGIPFVLATGRPPRWIPPVVAALPHVGLAVCANGATLYDAVTDRVLWSRTLAPETLEHLTGVVTDALPGCGFAAERASIGSLDAPFVMDPGYLNVWPGDRFDIVPRLELLTEPAVKMLVRYPGLHSAEMIGILAPLVGDHADLTFSHPAGLVEISAPLVTKASGLAAVAAEFGVTAAEVVAFGDMPNDLEMLRWAGHGVAMGNAHPAVLAEADEITSTNGDEGVALVLERWF